MRQIGSAFLLILILNFLNSRDVLAAGALVQVQQAKMRQARAQAEAQAQAQAQAQYQMQAQQQAAAQQYAQVQQAQAYMAQQQIIQAHMQQLVLSYIQQQQVKQVEEALAMKYLQQELAQRMAQAQITQIQQVKQEMMQQAVAAAVERAAYERALAQRDTAAAQAYLQSRNQAIAMYQQQQAALGMAQAGAVANHVAQQQVNQAVAQQLGVSAYVAGLNKPLEKVDPADIRQIVTIDKFWAKLDETSTAWPLLIDNYAKVMTVKEYMERFRGENVKIGQSPAYYVQMIDELAQQNKDLLKRPFRDLLQIIAIMEYDFDNGMDRDVLARKALGSQLYEANKKRLRR